MNMMKRREMNHHHKKTTPFDESMLHQRRVAPDSQSSTRRDNSATSSSTSCSSGSTTTSGVSNSKNLSSLHVTPSPPISNETSTTAAIATKTIHTNHHLPYYNDIHVDEEERRRTEMYERSCGLAQFFVNPWLFLWLKCHKVKMICTFLFCRKLKQQWSSVRRKKKDDDCHQDHRNHHHYRRHHQIYTFIHSKKQMIWRYKKLFGFFFVVKSIIFIMVFIYIPQWNRNRSMHYNHHHHRRRPDSSIIPIQIKLFQHRNAISFRKNKYTTTTNQSPNYGGLEIIFPKSQRSIESNNKNDTNYDVHIYKHYEFNTKTKCEDVSWRHLYQPNCNFFHEIHLDYELDYINSGFYRDVFSYQQKLQQHYNTNVVDKMALKILSPTHNITKETISEIWTEALIMERLKSSPRIMDIYGHCSTTVGSEFVQYEIENKIVPNGGYNIHHRQQQQQQHTDDDHYHDILPSQNKLNATEKISIALEMALSIADLHGFKDGVIVHDDIQLRQWLRSADDDGRLILGDFNRARIMRWNEEDGKFCKFRTGTVFGDYRSPEEYKEDALDEKIDIYSYGNNIYALLTGLWPFYNVNNTTTVQNKIIQGELPYVDDQYLNGSDEERTLVNVMRKCWEYDSSKRISIFEVIELLKEAMNKAS